MGCKKSKVIFYMEGVVTIIFSLPGSLHKKAFPNLVSFYPCLGYRDLSDYPNIQKTPDYETSSGLTSGVQIRERTQV